MPHGSRAIQGLYADQPKIYEARDQLMTFQVPSS